MGKREAVADWINKQFISWINQEGEHKTITALAKYLDVDRNLLGLWLNGKALPGNANVIRIANKFGPKIYDLLGWPRPTTSNQDE